MIFNKYQYNPDQIVKRGYSQHCIVKDENKSFWAKWILGIEKNGTKSKILVDRLRHLQKARHAVLPDIIEYGYDEEQKAFAIVYELLGEVQTFEDAIHEMSTRIAINGLLEVTDCLHELHLKYKINHGDIQPANILVDGNDQFYLIDFGLADITRTLSQAKELEIFAGAFAAPEKLNKTARTGFPYQADVFSLGKVAEWVFAETVNEIPEDSNRGLQQMMNVNPVDRPTWLEVSGILKTLISNNDGGEIEVATRNGNTHEIVKLLNAHIPVFHLSPKSGNNYLIDIIVGEYIFIGALWLKESKRLLVDKVDLFSNIEYKYQQIKLRESKKLPFSFTYVSTGFFGNFADLTPYLKKWFDIQQCEAQLRGQRKAGRRELIFYNELLDEEIKIIANSSLRIQYSNFSMNEDEIEFTIVPEKSSSIGLLNKHIDEGNDISSEGVEYDISANSDRKQNKKAISFVGKPYTYDSTKKIFKIKDCERLKMDSIPKSGYLFESTRKKEEEKRRQRDALRSVEKNEVQNPDLIHYLFSPEALPYSSDTNELAIKKIWQKDNNKKPFEYSYNQQKAILNAIHKGPLTVIQGPPGTGKTTVITEIVFQILDQKPESKILITSQTNNAVDQVLENLIKNKIPVLRLSGLTAPKIQAVKSHTLKRKLEGWKQQVITNAESHFDQLIKKAIANCQTKNPLVANLIEIIFNSTEWKQAKEKITKMAVVISNLKSLAPITDNKEETIAKIDLLLGSDISSLNRLYELHRNWVATINALDEKSTLNQKLIDSIRVVGATCNHIASKTYSKYNFEFDYIIMDESGKATTAEALVPIILGKNLVFVGDHRQLRPRLTSSREVEKWLRNKFKKESDELEEWDDYFNRASLFEQIITRIDHGYKSQLTECRRSSFDQVQLTSKCFYETEGDEAIIPFKRPVEKEHGLPLAINSSIVFIDIGSNYRNEKDEKSKSSKNNISADIIPQILFHLNRYDKISEYDIGVITGYAAQHRLISDRVHKEARKSGLKKIKMWKNPNDKQIKGEKLTVSVIDRFQGLERDIIIVDLVKSGPGLDLGFLETPNRINVALSRQKRLLIIVGDYYGIVNAKTRKKDGEKAALQLYLELIKKEWIIKAEHLKTLFQ